MRLRSIFSKAEIFSVVAPNPKLLESCTLPLTGVNCVKKIVTDLAVLEVKDGAFHLLERAPGVPVDEIIAKTAGKLIVEGEIPEMTFE